MDDHVLANAAGVFRSENDQHPELGRDDIEFLADVLADPVQFASTAGAGLALDIDDGLDGRQLGWPRAAIDAPLAHGLCLDRRRFGLGRSRLALLNIFNGEQQLIGGQCLGAGAEAVALQVLDDLDPPLRTNPLSSTKATW